MKRAEREARSDRDPHWQKKERAVLKRGKLVRAMPPSQRVEMRRRERIVIACMAAGKGSVIRGAIKLFEQKRITALQRDYAVEIHRAYAVAEKAKRDAAEADRIVAESINAG